MADRTFGEEIDARAPSPEKAEIAKRRAQAFGLDLNGSPDQINKLVQQEPERPKSRMRQFAESFDLGRDVLTPALRAVTSNPLRPESRQEGSFADVAARFLIPQSPEEQALVVGGPAIKGAVAGSKLLQGHKVLGPALGGTAAMAAAGGVGAVKRGDNPLTGAAIGGALGAGTEFGGAGVSKVVRGLPGMARHIASSKDQPRIVAEMLRAVPELKTPEYANITRDPAMLSEFIGEHVAGARLSQMMDRVGDVVERRMPMVDLPVLEKGPMPVKQAIKELSQYGQAGYGGYKDNPNLRVITSLEPREVWQKGRQELNEALLKADPTGGVVRKWNEAAHKFATGRSYMELLKPSAFGSEGLPKLEVPSAQKFVKEHRGEMRHLGPRGEVAGGHMASPPIDITVATEGPRKPSQSPPRFVEHETALPPASGSTVPALRESKGRQTSAPTSAGETLLHEQIPGRDDFASMVKALNRGAPAGSVDWDMVSALAGRGHPFLSGAAKLGMSLILQPNAGKIYVGQPPITIPPWVQNSINYGAMKGVQRLRPPAAE